MKILMLAHRLPYPPRTGDKVRAYHVARHLARHHDLTLASLIDETGTGSDVAALRQELPDVIAVTISRQRRRVAALLRLLAGGSATRTYFDSRHLRARLAARARCHRFDLVYVSSSSMTQYAAAVSAPSLVDFVDVDSDKWAQYGRWLPPHRAWIYRLEAKRLREIERAAARFAHRCLLATSGEEALLRRLAPWAKTAVIENGVDLDYFAPPSMPATDPVIVFTGAMDYFPNVDAVSHFARRVLPPVRAAVPEAQFMIVGRDPTRQVRRLTALPGVHVTGRVSDVRPFLRRSAVAVAPLRVARGIQNKVLEAMASGLPVVATRKAHEGLEARPGRDLLVEDDPARLATAVVGLLDAPERRRAIGQSARRFVEAHHSWAAALANLNRVIDEVVRRPAEATSPATLVEDRQ